jgi:hypothetical protein
VLASQYDVDEPTASSDNFHVYRDAVSSDSVVGRFDVSNAQHWARLGSRHGRGFEAVVFNNPHPGYGEHTCTVFGLDTSSGAARVRGRYISVHSLGDSGAGRLAPGQIARFKSLDANDTSPVQRSFLQADLGIIQNGSDAVLGCSRSGPERDSIDASFAQDADRPDDRTFHDREVHYVATRDTWGLRDFILAKFAAYGPRVLRSGGQLHVNGSESYENFIEEGGALAGFRDAGNWRQYGMYYCDYSSNWTTDAVHVSYLAMPNFFTWNAADVTRAHLREGQALNGGRWHERPPLGQP